MKAVDPVSLAFLLGLLGLVPLLLVVTTSFLKIATVLMLVRNALGVQQTPPNIALYALSLILSLYIMAPVLDHAGAALREQAVTIHSIERSLDALAKGAEPLRTFMVRHSKPSQRAFFMESARKMWPADQAARMRETDFLILIPAFVVSELTAAFEIGFLLYLPFVVIDLIVSNLLLALGMMMVSPMTISLPLKLFLFVMVDGWTRLLHGLVLSYA